MNRRRNYGYYKEDTEYTTHERIICMNINFKSGIMPYGIWYDFLEFQDGYNFCKMADLFIEIRSIRRLKKPNGDDAAWIFSITDFDAFQPRDKGMVWIGTYNNSSKEYLETAVDFLTKEKILVVQ